MTDTLRQSTTLGSSRADPLQQPPPQHLLPPVGAEQTEQPDPAGETEQQLLERLARHAAQERAAWSAGREGAGRAGAPQGEIRASASHHTTDFGNKAAVSVPASSHTLPSGLPQQETLLAKRVRRGHPI